MNDYLNLLEPEGLVKSFLDAPPEGFVPVVLNIKGQGVPGFWTRYDLLTTADERVKRFLGGLGRLLPRPRTLFVGTPVSEYSLFPKGISPEDMGECAVTRMNEEGFPLLIIKDMPMRSPLLSEEENAFSGRLISHLDYTGFTIMCGQALAFVPVTFHSIDDYLQGLSRPRRKDLKRKMQSFDRVSLETISTGSEYFDDSAVELLYSLYLNVYQNSTIHFDKLTPPFFKKVLQNGENRGVVFLYRHAEKVIGFNLCFPFRNCLIDKYIGFLYPDAQTFNLYFLSWIRNLDYCLQHGLHTLVAGWTDPEIKSYLGAEFTYTYHAVYARNTLLRNFLKKTRFLFESDKQVLGRLGNTP